MVAAFLASYVVVDDVLGLLAPCVALAISSALPSVCTLFLVSFVGTLGQPGWIMPLPAPAQVSTAPWCARPTTN